LQAAAVAPVCIAFIETSMRKKYTAGIGSRTMYSFVATNSTVPLHSSGLSSTSLRLPSGPRLQ
jgi:hypothetical protein